MVKPEKSQGVSKRLSRKRKCLPKLKLIEKKYAREVCPKQCKSLYRQVLQNQLNQNYYDQEKDSVLMNINLQRGDSYSVGLISSQELHSIYIPNQKILYPKVKNWNIKQIVAHILEGLNKTIEYSIQKFIGHSEKQMTTMLPISILTDSPRKTNHQIKPLGKVILTKKMFRKIFIQHFVDKDDNIKQYLLQGENKNTKQGNMKLFNFQHIKRKVNSHMAKLLTEEKMLTSKNEDNFDSSSYLDKIQIENPPESFYIFLNRTDKKLQRKQYYFQQYKRQYENLPNQRLRKWFVGRQNQQNKFIKDLKKKIKIENQQDTSVQDNSQNSDYNRMDENDNSQQNSHHNQINDVDSLEMEFSYSFESRGDFSLPQSVRNIVNPQQREFNFQQSIFNCLDFDDN